jgi:hypothetical protein
MEAVKRTVVTLDLATAPPDWPDVEEVVAELAQLPGIERVTIKHRLERACWLDVEVVLAGPDKAGLRAAYDRVTRAAMRPPLCLRSRRCVLCELYD